MFCFERGVTQHSVLEKWGELTPALRDADGKA